MIGSLVVSKLNAAYAASEEREPWRPRPSSLGDCIRKQAFLASGMEPFPSSPEALRVFELGHARGEALEAMLKRAFPFAETQLAVDVPGLGYGTIDALLHEHKAIIDFKTTATFGFGLLDSEGVSEDYQLQLHAYRTTRPDPREWMCLVVYEAKDSDARKGIKAGSLKALEVPWSEELEKRYRLRLLQLQTIVDDRAAGRLDPTSFAALPPLNGKRHWKCSVENGKPRFCSIGPERGQCYP